MTISQPKDLSTPLRAPNGSPSRCRHRDRSIDAVTLVLDPHTHAPSRHHQTSATLLPGTNIPPKDPRQTPTTPTADTAEHGPTRHHVTVNHLQQFIETHHVHTLRIEDLNHLSHPTDLLDTLQAGFPLRHLKIATMHFDLATPLGNQLAHLVLVLAAQSA